MMHMMALKWTVPGQQRYADSVFPFAYKREGTEGNAETVRQWVEPQRTRLLEYASLHGAVLLRDFPLRTPTDFDSIIEALGVENFPYKQSLSNAVRTNFTDRVFSANEAPSEVNIFLHHEMAQTPLFPNYIFFFCEIAAEEGGATPICRSDVLYEKCVAEVPDLIQALEAKGLKYSNVMPGADDPKSGMGRSWQSTLGVTNSTAAEKRLSELGYSWNWLENGCLRATTPVLPAVREVALGRKTLFNQLIAAFSGWKDDRNDPGKAVRLGDEQPLDGEQVRVMIDIANDITFPMQWQPGDCVIIDNTLVMHGRSPFKGKRKVLASLGNKQTHSFASA